MTIRRGLVVGCAGLWLGLGGCAPQTAAPAAAPAEVAPLEASPDQPRSEPRFGPMLFPGERFEAQVSRGVLTVGSITLVVDEACLQDGAEVIPTLSHAERVGLYGIVEPGRVDTVSWLERATGLPLWNRSAGETPKRSVNVAVTFDRHEYHYAYRSRRHSATKPGKTRHKSRPLPPGEITYDGHAALGALRSWATTPGTHGMMHVVLGRVLWRVELEVGHPGEVSVGGETHDAILIEGTARRVTTKLKPSKRARRWSLWISDDEQRLPLKARVEHRKGIIDIELADYEFEPPEAKRLAPCDDR
ncbi:MAG: DUF3108 domain-containing protein [Deltaproteobacteria bacterium]|nr:DUF3108 domain-containing protein [Deltaproteobacteria bacterium]